MQKVYISDLSLENFRNYKKQNFCFSQGVNIVYGLNAQGKTNVAEAIFYICTGYSPRVTREKQVVLMGQEKAAVSAVAQTKTGRVSAEIEFYSAGGKKITLNGLTVKRVGELIGNINAVMFNPQELKLVQQSPEDRRRFLDISLSQINRRYFYALLKYKQILLQRNALLKNPDRDLIISTLPVWDEQFAEVAASIIFDRNGYIEELKPLCERAHREVSGGKEKLEVEGESNFTGDKQKIEADFKAALFERTEKDVEAGFTTIGPHRDDLKIKLDGIDLRVYGSQGQQRTAALALKLAEVEIFKNHFGESPVLILDDAMSELDTVRRTALLGFLNGVQTIITCTDSDGELLRFADKVFYIQNGTATVKDEKTAESETAGFCEPDETAEEKARPKN